MESSEKFEKAQIAYKGKIRTFARNAMRSLPNLDGFATEDVEQELLVVLWKCCITYHPEKGATFNTYFSGCAKNRIRDLIRMNNEPKRSAAVISLDEESIRIAVEDLVRVSSAEDRVMSRLKLQEFVRRYGAEMVFGFAKRQAT